MNIKIETLNKEELDKMIELDRYDRVRHKLTDEDIEGLIRYVGHRIEPGSFLLAILENNLTEACGRADMSNRRRIFEYVEWLYNKAPSICWGSPAKVDAWLQEGMVKKL